MRIIILENSDSISDFIIQNSNYRVDKYRSVEEFLANDYSQGCIVLIKNIESSREKLKQISDNSLFTIFISDEPDLGISNKASFLPTRIENKIVLSTIDKVADLLFKKGRIEPIHSDVKNSGLYETLRRDMEKDAARRKSSTANVIKSDVS